MEKEISRISGNDCERHKFWFDHMLADLIAELKDFPYAVVKGEVLSIMAYGGCGYRNYHDVDFLIPKNARKKFLEIIRKNGFREDVRDENGQFRSLSRKEKIILLNSHQDIDYIKIDGSNFVNIDINYDLFWGEYNKKRIDVEEFLADSEILQVYNTPVKVLSRVKNFIQLCLHHYREMNSIYLFKLVNPFHEEMFRDVYFLFDRMTGEEYERLSELIWQYQINEYVYYVVYYTYFIYRDDRLLQLLKRIYTADAERFLNCFGLTEKERKEWNLSLEERMSCEDLFREIEPLLTKEDIDKVETTIGFITLDEGIV